MITKKIKSKKKIFISGSGGFIGKHLKISLKKNYTLLTPTKNTLNLKNNNKLNSYLKTKKPDIIIHLAGSTKFKQNKKLEKKNQHINTFISTKNLANNINPECQLIVFFGSIAEYGNIKTPFLENSKLNPLSYYGKYKSKSYYFIKKILDKKKLNYVWVRPSLAYGAGDNNDRFLGYILNSIKKNKSFTISPGNQIRDYIHISDLCKIVVLIILNYKKIYRCRLNLSSQNYIMIKKIPSMIEKIIKKKLNYILNKSLNNEVNLLNSNKKLLNFFPKLKFINFKMGLTKTLKDESII
tara:strand:+ start:2539 stop:3426 length:888 start_codon:yes stop_codon:yes gene_type:complete